MNYFDSDMSKSTNTVVYFDWKTVIYIYVCGQCHNTIYAAKFEQTIIHQHVHLRRESQSHAPAHVLMRLYPIDKSLVCLQSERRTSCQNCFHYLDLTRYQFQPESPVMIEFSSDYLFLLLFTIVSSEGRYTLINMFTLFKH